MSTSASASTSTHVPSVDRFSLTAQHAVESDFDHLIVLKDNTGPVPALSFATKDSAADQDPPPPSPTTDRLTKRDTGSSAHSARRRTDNLRKHLAERKYQRRWKQENELEEEPDQGSASSSDDDDPLEESSSRQASKDFNIKPVLLRHTSTNSISLNMKARAKEFPHVVNAKKEDMQKKGISALRRAKEKGRRYRKEEFVDEIGEIDILYENQRGAFMCGIPLFSSRSLLPTDSPAWTNRHHNASPVTIVNAQVPDPTWEWSWKTWFVDMTGDVDEEGWQYSLAFRGTKWHGVSIWWHGFVRRRRWIRKRVKRRLTMDDNPDAHAMTPDYFTIHSRRSSPGPANRGDESVTSSERRSSRWVDSGNLNEFEQEEQEDILDVPSLLKAFKRARLDREKIDALEKFVRDGQDEVAYLADNIPYVMSSMIFQNSRQTLLTLLVQSLLDVQKKRSKRKKTKETPLSHDDDEKEIRYIDGLGRAVEAAESEVRKLEFWSDVKRVQSKGYAGVENRGNEERWDGARIPVKTAEEVYKGTALAEDGEREDDMQSINIRSAGVDVVAANSADATDGMDEELEANKAAMDKGKGRQDEEDDRKPVVKKDKGKQKA